MKLQQRLRHLSAALTGRVSRPPVFARYAGGDHSRIVSRWFAALDDPNNELRVTLADLRARSRELVRDNGEASGLLLDFEADIVGATGARLQFRARTPRGLPRAVLNDRVETAWQLWGRRDSCTATGRLTWPAVQRLFIRSIVQDGEFLALREFDPSLPYGYRLAVLDPDQLDETYSTHTPQANGNTIAMGVELDARGRAVAYHIWDRHPSLLGRVRQRIPADRVLHAFKTLRPGQVRGVPWFAPALITWKLGARYTEAELYQSMLAAAQGGFFVNKEGGSFDVPTDDNGNPIPLVMEAEPGAARVLPGGYEFQAWEPKHPTANYAGFMKVVKRTVARAFGRSYASLTGDLADVNFSSMRTDRVREIEQNRVHQHDLLVDQLCAPVFADWVRMAAVTGKLGVVQLDAETLTTYATWMCKGWPWIDPVKDATAAKLELDMGATSPQRICADKGRDYFEVIDEIAEARAYAAEKGVPLNAVPLALTVSADAPADVPLDNSAPPATVPGDGAAAPGRTLAIHPLHRMDAA